MKIKPAFRRISAGPGRLQGRREGETWHGNPSSQQRARSSAMVRINHGFVNGIATVPNTKWSLDHGAPTKVERAFVAADWASGRIPYRPTIAEAAVRAGVSPTYACHALHRQAERAEILAGRIPLIRPSRSSPRRRGTVSGWFAWPTSVVSRAFSNCSQISRPPPIPTKRPPTPCPRQRFSVTATEAFTRRNKSARLAQ